VIQIVAIVALVVVAVRQHGRLGLLEREIGALRSFVLSTPPAVGTATVAAASTSAGEPLPQELAAAPEAPATASAGEPSEAVFARQAQEPVADATGPWQAASGSVPVAPPAAPAADGSKRPDIETALGTRWAVWVGGVALALGGLFLIRYSIEAGIFGPGVRLTMAALLGLALTGAGEFIRRTGFKLPVEGAAGAYVPGVLTAAGAFTLFGTVYAAHGIYGFIGPAAAFTLLGAIGIGAIALALVHGQALGGIGLLGSMLTPALVSSQSPNAWALFGYLAIVLVANTAIARLRGWVFLVAAGFVGVGLWCSAYVFAYPPVAEMPIVLFINAAVLGSLAFIWLRSRPEVGDVATGSIDWPSTAPALFTAIASAALLLRPEYQAAGGSTYGTALLVAMLLVALYRAPALPLLYAAGIAAVLVHARTLFSGYFTFDVFTGGEVIVEAAPASPFAASLRPAGTVLAVAFLAAGYWYGRLIVAQAPVWRSASWVGWGTLVPLVVLFTQWIIFGNLDRDLFYAAVALLLVAIFVAGGELIARNEAPPLEGRLPVSFALGGAGVAAVLMLHMAFGSFWTTVLVGAAAIAPALATRWRSYPVLGWLSAGAVVVVIGRIAFDPTIVGAEFLGTTPVFNALLPGYGIPALAFAFSAWQLARTTDGRPRLVMEAAAALFGLLTLAMLVRHAMHGGVIDASEPTLAEQAIYTLLAIGAGAILVAIDTRSPSPVLRIGSMAAGIVSAGLIVGQHFFVLNPLFTGESTGKIPVFNLLFLAYLLPAIAAGALAFYARGKRPRWYSAMLALLASALVFVYATLSLRRLFQGEYIPQWAGMTQLETYSYSALWLAMGVALLVAGVRLKSQALRIASAVLIAVAVAKVFIFDMSELEGVLRALSFIGLGAVLIGIGLFYQRLLTQAARSADDTAAPVPAAGP
jgi:uncharacterized membrane protein